METLADLFVVALEIVVQLGIPVVVIYVMGYTTHRADRRRSVSPGPGRPTSGRPNRHPVPPIAGGAGTASDAQRQYCPLTLPRQASSSQLFLPCWQTAKSASGRLRSECLDCRAFLTTPATR